MKTDEFIETIFIKDINYHSDILFLKKRLIELFEKEEYEKIARVRKWIDDLIMLHHGDEIKK